MNDPHHRTTRARRRVRTARGAAMVESVIVVSTMVVFMGLIAWTRQSYAMKLDLQQSTRSNVLYYASHGCTGAGASTESSGSVNLEGDTPEADNAARKSSAPNKAAASRSFNTASASTTGTSSWYSAYDVNAGGGGPINLQRRGLSRPITADSKVTCNEKSYETQWTAWLEFGADFVGRGAGVVDLFK